MTTNELTTTQGREIVTAEATDALVALVLDALTSEHSKRAYKRALLDFLEWHATQGRPPLSKALVQSYRAKLVADGLAPKSVNLKLTAIRKLATEAADNAMIDPTLAEGVARVKGVKSAGTRAGNWLSIDDAQALLRAPDTTTRKGLKDRAILAVLLGCGLRRSEGAALIFEHIQQRDGRWAIVDLQGKGGRVRTVPMPSWVKVAIDEWATAADIVLGRVFREVNRGDTMMGDGITPQAVADVVRLYGKPLGHDRLAAHDLRRTHAKLAMNGSGGNLAQVSLALGHADLTTTQRYLGLELDLSDAPADHIPLRL